MADSPPRSDAPDWETLALELHCPRCGYDLRRLPQPRCPECGLEFQWTELIAATEDQLQSPLFEYQWQHRPVRSFFKTIGRAMLPWLLRREARMALQPRVVPLLVFVLPMLLLHALVCLSAEYGWATFMDWWYTKLLSSTQLGVGLVPHVNAYLQTLLGALVLLVLTWLVLQVFHQTINQYHIRWQHFLRILVLAGSAFLMWRALMVVVLYLQIIISTCTKFWASRTLGWVSYPHRLAGLTDLVPLSVFALAVSAGMGRYLQVRRGWIMGFLSTFIVLLFLLTSVTALTALVGRADNVGLRGFGNLWPGLGHLVRYAFAH